MNEHFSSGKPGYKTDRGRIYLKYGKPDEIDSHPAGGRYEREAAEGSGSTSTYPFERWFYRSIPGRSGAQLEFVDPTGTGEYRLALNPFQKDAMLTVPGAAPTTDGRSQAEYLQASFGVGNPFSMRQQDSPFEWLDLYRIVNAPLRPSVDVEYALIKDGKELGKQAEDWRGSRTSGDRLTLSRLIDSRHLTPGEYRIEMRIADRVSGQTLVQSSKFTVLP